MVRDGWGADPPVYRNSASINEFSREIRIGEIYGARTFRANQDGTLMGVVLSRFWEPGVTTAECWRPTGWDVLGVGVSNTVPRLKQQRVPTGRMVSISGTDMPEHVWEPLGWSWTVDGVEGYATVQPKPIFGNQDDAHHDLGKCVCGLHGYMSGSLDYAQYPDAISGVLRGFGTVSMGDRGFRAQYAQIVALYVPTVRIPLEERIDRPEPMAPLRAGFARGSIGRDVTPELVDKIRAKYNVPIYHDLDQMLTDWPTEPPREPAKAVILR